MRNHPDISTLEAQRGTFNPLLLSKTINIPLPSVRGKGVKERHVYSTNKMLPLLVQAANAQYIAIKETQKKVRDVRYTYIQSILAVGALPGCRMVDIGYVLNIGNSGSFARMRKIIGYGFIEKDNARYYLTERGRRVYDIFMAEYTKQFDQLLARIKKEVLAEIVAERLRE